MPEILDEPYLVTKAAIHGDRDGVKLRLNKFSSYVDQMAENPEKDRYSRFLALYYAVPDAGAEVYYSDFQRRHFARMAGKVSRPADVAKLMQEINDQMGALNSAGWGGDFEAVVREGTTLLHVLGDLIGQARRCANEEESVSEGSRQTVTR